MEPRTPSVLNRFSLDVAERVISYLPSSDLANLRLVNKQWKQFTNRYVRRLRPRTLAWFLTGAMPERYPSAKVVDLSLVDILDDVTLAEVTQVLAALSGVEDVTLRCGAGVSPHGFTAFAAQLPRLTRLRLSAVVSGCTPNAAASFDLEAVPFEAFPKLTQLDLSWNMLSYSVVQSVSGLPNLEVLSLKNCLGVDDAVLEALTQNPKLRVLNLACTNITDDGLMTMNDLELEVLNLSRCERVTDDGMFWLQHIRTLKKVDVSSCPGISTAGVEQLTNLPNLSDLYLQDMKPLGSSFFKKMKNLRTVSLRDCCWMTDQMVQDLTSCHSLQSINLRNCTQITDAGLKWLKELPELRSVNLRGCSQVTDLGLMHLSALPTLEDVDLSFLCRITDDGLQSLAPVTALRRLILNWCHLITSVGLHSLQSSCPDLTELSIKGCHNMQFTDLVSMANVCSFQKLDYEHSLCTVHQDDHDQELPLMRPIDSVGCFMEIC